MLPQPKTLLLVEDNRDHAELIKRTLADVRIKSQIIHFFDGQSALDYLFRQGKYGDPPAAPRPDIVLLDLRLPGLDGIAILREIKQSEELRTIPVVILSTSNAEKDMSQAYQNHANSYLVKPVGYQEFVRLMNDLAMYWLGCNFHPVD